MGPSDPVLELHGIRKRFGATVALDDESLSVGPGEIVGLMGHNGAGKSTLVNVATGAIPADAGDMKVLGETVPLSGRPLQMERAGLKVIHQEPALCGNLSIADNLTLGNAERTTHDKHELQAGLDAVGLSLNLDRPVDTLSLSQRQLVDLARAMIGPVRALFLDEPTAALGRHETERLHSIIEGYAAEGRAIIYVSHRLRDILSVCTRLVVLRDGRIVLDVPRASVDLQDLTDALAPPQARAKSGSLEGVPKPGGEVAAGAPRATLPGLDSVVELRAGQITGLFGMANGPQFRLLEAMFGLASPVRLTLDGEEISIARPRDAIRHGIYYLSGERERDSLIPDRPATDNLLLPWMSKLANLLGVPMRACNRAWLHARQVLSIRGPGGSASVSAFSGGNRQKIALGRWLFTEAPKVLLLAQPTQGVDITSRQEIAEVIRGVAASGVAVAVATCEADEVMLLCDEAFTVDGRQAIPVPRTERWESTLMQSLLNSAA